MSDEAKDKDVSNTQTEGVNSGGKDDGSQERKPEAIPYARFQEVNAAKNEALKKSQQVEAELAKIKTEQAEAQAKALAEQGEFKELYENASSEIANLKTQITQTNIASQVRSEIATKVSFTDPKERENAINAIHKLMNSSDITITDGIASGVNEAIEKVKSNYSMLFTPANTEGEINPNPNTVNNSAPGIGQTQDLKADDILKADGTTFKTVDDYYRSLG